jgi:hypothetical protein
MALIASKCENCGGKIEFSKDNKKGFCLHCDTAFIADGTVNNYNNTTVINQTIVYNSNTDAKKPTQKTSINKNATAKEPVCKTPLTLKRLGDLQKFAQIAIIITVVVLTGVTASIFGIAYSQGVYVDYANINHTTYQEGIVRERPAYVVRTTANISQTNDERIVERLWQDGQVISAYETATFLTNQGFTIVNKPPSIIKIYPAIIYVPIIFVALGAIGTVIAFVLFKKKKEFLKKCDL